MNVPKFGRNSLGCGATVPPFRIGKFHCLSIYYIWIVIVFFFVGWDCWGWWLKDAFLDFRVGCVYRISCVKLISGFTQRWNGKYLSAFIWLLYVRLVSGRKMGVSYHILSNLIYILMLCKCITIAMRNKEVYELPFHPNIFTKKKQLVNNTVAGKIIL